MQVNICFALRRISCITNDKKSDVAKWRQDDLCFVFFELEISNVLINSFEWHICHEDIFSVTPRTVWPRRYLGWIWCYLDCQMMPNCRSKHWQIRREAAARGLVSVIWVFYILVLGSWYLMVKNWHWSYTLPDRVTTMLSIIFYEYNLYFFINYWWSWDIIEI